MYKYRIDTEYFSQRIQCSRDDKYECLRTIQFLAEVENVYHSGGVAAVDRLLETEPTKFSAVFLYRAVELFMDVKSSQQIRTVLYNRIITSNFVGAQFLNGVVITEALCAILDKESSDYIFNFLIPPFFGIDFEDNARQAYRDFRRSKMKLQGS